MKEKRAVGTEAGARSLNQGVSMMWDAVTYIVPSGPSEKVSGQRRRLSDRTVRSVPPSHCLTALSVGEVM